MSADAGRRRARPVPRAPDRGGRRGRAAGADAARAAGRGRRGPRPERRGQEHAAARPGRPRGAVGRAALRSWGRSSARLSPGARAGFRAARIGLVDQHHDRALPAALTCLDAVALPLALRGAPRPRGGARAAELLERVGLADRAGALPAELSGGERQRVAVCAALAHRPGLLLADEPGGELDAAAARAVYDLIAELAREHAATVLVVSHDPAATRIADRTRPPARRAHRPGGRGRRARRRSWSAAAAGCACPASCCAAAGLGGRLRAEAGPGELRLRAGARRRRPARRRGRAAPRRAAAVAPAPRRAPRAAGAAARRRQGLRRARRAARLRPRRRAGPADGALRALGLGQVDGAAAARRPRGARTRATVTVGADALHGRSRGALAALRRAGIGVVEQSPALADHLSAEENVALGLVVRGRRAPPRPARIAEARWPRSGWPSGCASAPRACRPASASASRSPARSRRAPGLLLVDEPTSRLDEAGAASIAALLAGLSAAHGTTILCATHEPLVVAASDAEVALGAADGGLSPRRRLGAHPTAQPAACSAACSWALGKAQAACVRRSERNAKRSCVGGRSPSGVSGRNVAQGSWRSSAQSRLHRK